MFKKYIVNLSFLIILCFSCKKEQEKLTWDADILFPILKSQLGISDIITDTSLIKSASDSLVTLVYEDTLYTLSVDKFIYVPDTTFSTDLEVPITFYLSAGGQIIPPWRVVARYDFKGPELTYARLKSGKTIIELTTPVNEAMVVNYGIPSATLKGVPFNVKIKIPAAPPGGNITFRDTFDLSGYEVNMKGYYGNRVNTIEFVVSASLCDTLTCPGAKGDSVFVGEHIIPKVSFKDILPDYARGYIKDTIDIGPEETMFGLFKGVKANSILMEKASVTVAIENGFGLDFRTLINGIYSKNTAKGSVVNLNSQYIGFPINVNRSVETGNPAAPVNPSMKTIMLDNTNSNVKTLFENLPDAMGCSLRIIANPLGNQSGSNDFIYADHGMKLKLKAEIPLSVSASGITFTDTLFSDMSGLKDKNRINYGKLLLHADNGFAFDMKIQIYLMDDTFVITDSLLTHNDLVYGAPVDVLGKPEGTKRSTLEIPLSKIRLDRIITTRWMLVKATINTVNPPQYIKIYSGNTIKVKLVGDFNYRMELK